MNTAGTTYRLGATGDIEVTAEPSAIVGALALWGIFAVCGRWVFRLAPAVAFLAGLFSTALHFLSEIIHQLGHAMAARRAGYPMQRMHLWAVLGRSVYPVGEPELRPRIHIQRALGGPTASLVMTLVAGLLALGARPLGRLPFMLTSILALENLLIFTIGALLPIKAIGTDGAVILRYWRPEQRDGVIIQE